MIRSVHLLSLRTYSKAHTNEFILTLMEKNFLLQDFWTYFLFDAINLFRKILFFAIKDFKPCFHIKIDT